MVQRYTESLRGGITESGTGDWVSYNDYQKLEKELQQRAETAETTITEQDALILSYQETIRNQTAKLAVLENPPHKTCDACIDVLGSLGFNYKTAKLKDVLDEVKKLRPAPAVNLAELVPVEMVVEPFSRPVEAQKTLEARAEGFNLCRAAILRNIEEQSK